jgi:hypothetical protein
MFYQICFLSLSIFLYLTQYINCSVIQARKLFKEEYWVGFNELETPGKPKYIYLYLFWYYTLKSKLKLLNNFNGPS